MRRPKEPEEETEVGEGDEWDTKLRQSTRQKGGQGDNGQSKCKCGRGLVEGNVDNKVAAVSQDKAL